MTKWKAKSRPEILIKSINNNFSVSDNGSYSSKLKTDFDIDALLSMVDHNFVLSKYTLFSLFKESLVEIHKVKKSNDSGLLLKVFGNKCSQLNKVKSKYVLITSISLENSIKLKRRRLLGCSISFYKSLPKKYIRAREDLLSRFESFGVKELSGYMFVTVSMEAPTEYEAYEKGMKALDFLRSLWQLNAKKGISFLEAGGDKYFTDSMVGVGKIHTLHKPNGKEATNIAWIEDNFFEKKPAKFKNHLKFQEQCKYVNKLIAKSRFKDHIQQVLINYIQSLDQNELEFRFLKLWTVVEILLCTDKTTELSKRISFLFNERDEVMQVINSLRDARNTNTHKGKPIINAEMKNFLLVSYFESVIWYFIKNPFGFNKIKDFIEFLSISTDLEEVERKIKHYTKVRKFISREK